MARLVEKRKCLQRFFDHAEKRGCQESAWLNLSRLCRMFDDELEETEVWLSPDPVEGSIYFAFARKGTAFYNGGLIYFESSNDYSIHS